MAISSMAHKTFWNKIRVERNIRHKDLLELFPSYKSAGAIASWFTGQCMPPDHVIQVLCDFFDVDFNEGKAEFEKAHKTWMSTFHKAGRVVTGQAEPIGDRETTGRADARIASVAVEDVDTNSINIFKMVYGALTYEEFMLFAEAVATKNSDPLLYIYGKVSYEEFRKIAENIGG